MKITKWFSALIVSGQGQKCNDLKGHLHDELLEFDHISGKFKIEQWREGNDIERISKSLGKRINPIFKDVPQHIWTIDKK